MLLVAAVGVAPTPSSAGQIAIGVSVRIGPPPLPVYAQPVCPGPGYIWTPGYWAYDPVEGYYWVPGTWVVAPGPGLLWTPGYWGWSGGAFFWHAGYWGPHVGFYGGINYGFGYVGVGYVGGEWRGGRFFYNRAVNNVNVVNVTNVYNRTVVNNVRVTRVSFNGGPGGINARPTAGEMAAEHDRHIAATRVQQQHFDAARMNRAQFASVNHGRPTVTATARPGEFHANNAAPARGGQQFTPHGPNRNGPNNPPATRGSYAGGGGNRSVHTANAPTPHSTAKPEVRTANTRPTHQGTSNSKGGGPHPQAQTHNARPSEEGKEKREPERR